jgi:hypothetical protein
MLRFGIIPDARSRQMSRRSRHKKATDDHFSIRRLLPACGRTANRGQALRRIVRKMFDAKPVTIEQSGHGVIVPPRSCATSKSPALANADSFNR